VEQAFLANKENAVISALCRTI